MPVDTLNQKDADPKNKDDKYEAVTLETGIPLTPSHYPLGAVYTGDWKDK